MDAGLLDAVMGPIWAALGAVSHKALSKAEDQVADETVRLGGRLMARLRRGPGSNDPVRPQLEAAATDLAAAPADGDFRAALRGQVRKALSGADGVDDPRLTSDLTELLGAAGIHISAHGAGAMAIGHNEGIVSTGKNARNTINRVTS